MSRFSCCSARTGARDFRAKGFRMMAYGVDTLLMQGALADGIRLLQGTVEE
jgi:hypothetical protein